MATQVVAVVSATSASKPVGSESLVDEMIIRFTHTIELDWMLPGIAPTGKRVECATVRIIQFRDGKLFSEHLYRAARAFGFNEATSSGS